MRIIFHIGLHKTATSWLQQVYFPDHPQMAPLCDSRHPWDDAVLKSLIGSPAGKFDSAQCKKRVLRQISQLCKEKEGKVAIISSERLCGHPGSGGYDRLRIAQRIRACWDDSLVLFLVRDQVGMITSVYKQMLVEGYPGSLHDMLHTRGWDTATFDLSFYEYDLLLQHYRELFGEERVVALPYEMMRETPEQFFSMLCERLALPPHMPSSGPLQVNPSLANRGLGLYRRLNSFHRSELSPCPVFSMNTKAYRFATRVIRKLFSLMPQQEDLMDFKTKSWIREYYEASNARFQHMTGWNPTSTRHENSTFKPQGG